MLSSIHNKILIHGATLRSRALTLALIPFLFITACSKSDKPETVVENCLKELSSDNLDNAAELFAGGDTQLKWFKMYYDGKDLSKLFDGSVKNVFINGDKAIVTYTPTKTLFNAFNKDDLLLLEKEKSDWKINFKESTILKNAINGGGINTNLYVLKSCIKEATKKLGRPPMTIQEIIDNLEIEGAKSSVRSYSRIFDYYPEGKTIDGVQGVIFYSKEPYKYGMHIGSTKKNLFLSGDGKVIAEKRL